MTFKVMMVDDDEDDRMMFEEAMEDSRMLCDISFAEDGQDMLEKLNALSDAELPQIILLDLNMPRKDGWESLSDLKAAKRFKDIPVIILTTSNADADIVRSYHDGGSSFISKPVSFDDFVGVIQKLTSYWFDVVSLPRKELD